MLKNSIQSWDDRREIIILPTEQETLLFAQEHWIHSAKRAIQQRGRFAVALSGGSTPKTIYQSLAQSKDIDWTNVFLFWSDERAVPPDHPNSNYHMASQTGLVKKVPASQVFRMKAETEIQKHANQYEEFLTRYLDKHLFDLVMLGMGEDGHIASLFPLTTALQEESCLTVANYIENKKEWRMTLTFPAIHQSLHSVVYVLGAQKKETVKKVLEAPILSKWPASRLGTTEHKTLWVLDEAAAALL